MVLNEPLGSDSALIGPPLHQWAQSSCGSLEVTSRRRERRGERGRGADAQPRMRAPLLSTSPVRQRESRLSY